MKSSLLIIALTIGLSGCATQNTHNLTTQIPDYPQKLVLPVSTITVSDASKTSKYMEFTIGLGFERMADRLYKPTPGEMLKTKIEQSITANGTTNTLDIQIVDAGLYVKREVEDRIPVVNLFAFGRTIRPFMCSTQVVIKSGTKSEQKTFSSNTPPLDPTDDQAFRIAINKCQYELINNIFEASKQLL